ncbi:hypothetical protein DV735_g1764, partial [Chaetothyriales sp. CBS 134920]
MAFGGFFGRSSNNDDKSSSTTTFESQAPAPSDAALATADPSGALSPSPPNATSAQIRQRLQNAVLYQTNVMNAKFLISKVNENCFEKCVPTPGTILSSKEQACLSSCLEKYVEAWNTRKPTCKNCDKPGRVCRYELSKRDHHNPTVETLDLPKYFNRDDRPDYSAEQLASFQPVPNLITWTTPRTLNNFDDEIFYEADATPGEATATMARAQQTATDGLQALSAAAANYTAQALATYSGGSSANVIDPSLDSRRLSPSPIDGVERQDSRAAKTVSDVADVQLAQALLEAQHDENIALQRAIDADLKKPGPHIGVN